MRTLILTLAIMFVGVVTIPVAGAGAALSSVPGYGAAATDSYVLEAQRLPDLNIEVHTADGGSSSWYENPVWVAIGALGLLLAIVLIVMASRGGGTTVLKT